MHPLLSIHAGIDVEKLCHDLCVEEEGKGGGEIGRHYKLPMVLLFQRLLLLLMDEEEAPGKTPLPPPPVVGTVGRSQRVKEREKTRGGEGGGEKKR